MTVLRITILIFLIAECSCKNTRTKIIDESTNFSTNSLNDSLSTKTETQKIPAVSLKDSLPTKPEIQSRPSDRIQKFTVDDYPVTNKMFEGVDRSRESGEISSGEGAWFSNDTLKQTLVFVRYTDDHRLVTYHFLNSDIPNGVINRMELHSADGELATFKQKQKYFRGYLTQTKKIKQSYFRTNKGFKLGDSKEKALKVYGNPDKTKIENGIEKYEWDFIGDILYDGKTNLKGKPLAKDNYGHQATMFFRNKKLIGIIFHNDIP
jgi:hypothetical protein